MHKKLLLLFSLLFIFHAVFAQERSVQIQVKDAEGKPLNGATVKNKTNKQTLGATAANGAIIVKVSIGTQLTITAIGFLSKDIDIQAANSYQVILQEEVQMLQTTVVTALGIRRSRNSVPYSTQQVTAEELNRTPGNNFIEGLSGKVAGLQITSNSTLGGTNNVILRGFKSLTQSNQALFVVDGVPFDNSNNSRSGLDNGNAASDINPEDIESVSVLKGAAASALYGSRAVNGVILITTKKKTSGAGRADITLNQSIQLGTIDQSTLPTYQKAYGQGKGSAGYNSANPTQSGYFYYLPAIGSGGVAVPIVITNQDLAWGPAYNGNLAVYNWDSFVPGNPNYKKATPWLAAKNSDAVDYFQSPFASNTSLSINTAQDKSTFKVGYTNSYERGISPNSFLKKNIFNFAGSYHLTSKLTTGASVNYANVSAKNRSTYDYRAANTNVRDLRQWVPSNVNYDALRADYERGLNASWNILAGSYNTETGDVIKAAYHNNPYWNDYENYNNDTKERLFGNVYANYDLAKGLKATARIARDGYTQFFENRVAVGSYQTALYARSNVQFEETNYDFLLNFDRDLATDLNLKALLGVNIRRSATQSIAASTSGGLLVPRLYAVSNSVATPIAPIEYDGTKQVNGFFGGFTLGYKEILTLDATGRYDQSSALPKANNSYFYPAVSGSFAFSKLLGDVSWLSFGKLRLNYAEVGSDAPIYSVRNTYVAGTPFNGQNIYSNPLTNNNPDLKPERNKNYEAGIETSFLRNRINLDVTYYHSRLTNQITPITPSAATGYNNFYVNGGTIQNQGVEVVLNVVPVQTADFKYDFSVNWAKNENKVISLYGGQSSYTIASYQNSIQLVAEVGQSYGTLRGSDYVYVNGQRLVDAAGYYVKSSNRNSNIGSIAPDWIGGITNRFRYKNVALIFLVDASHGGDVYSLDLDNGSRSGILAETAGLNDLGNPLRNPLSQGGGIILPGVKADGSPNTVRVDVSDANTLGSKLPFGSTNALTAKSYVFDASYVKLREVAVSYNLPSRVFEKAKAIKGATFTLSGRNLWIIHKNLPYADPEQGAPSTTLANTDPIIYNSNASIGYQNAVFPTVREFAFNIRLNF